MTHQGNLRKIKELEAKIEDLISQMVAVAKANDTHNSWVNMLREGWEAEFDKRFVVQVCWLRGNITRHEMVTFIREYVLGATDEQADQDEAEEVPPMQRAGDASSIRVSSDDLQSLPGDGDRTEKDSPPLAYIRRLADMLNGNPAVPAGPAWDVEHQVEWLLAQLPAATNIGENYADKPTAKRLEEGSPQNNQEDATEKVPAATAEAVDPRVNPLTGKIYHACPNFGLYRQGSYCITGPGNVVLTQEEVMDLLNSQAAPAKPAGELAMEAWEFFQKEHPAVFILRTGEWAAALPKGSMPEVTDSTALGALLKLMGKK
jgi:hypothetical protein